MMTKIAPSILAGDHGNLSGEAKRLENWKADWIHVDIMDGDFAPNLTFGPGAVKAIRKSTRLPLDCHLMLAHPEMFVNRFLDSGGDIITVHAEALNDTRLSEIETSVKKFGAKLGVAFKPSTPLSSLDLSKHAISLVTIMTVNPGFSGQKFMPEVIPKVKEASQLYSEMKADIEVDGGVDISNAKMLCDNGATVLVAGNSVFGQPDPEHALKELKKAVE
jgi:ribulose-phosphate 3-epimerase